MHAVAAAPAATHRVRSLTHPRTTGLSHRWALPVPLGVVGVVGPADGQLPRQDGQEHPQAADRSPTQGECQAGDGRGDHQGGSGVTTRDQAAHHSC